MLKFVKKQFDIYYLIIFLVLLTFLIILPKGGLQGDLEYWIRWVNWIKELGLAQVYSMSEVNYFPIYLYFLGIFGLVVQEGSLVVANIYLIKVIFIIFDVASIALLGYLLKKQGKSPYLSLLVLFNLAFFYNSMLFGQIEAFYIFFVMAALIAALYKHPHISVICYTLAFYSKLQAIVFLPSVILLLLPYYFKNKRLLLPSVAAVILTHFVLLFPWIIQGTWPQMFANVFHSVDLFPVLSMNAFNFWLLLLSGASSITPDSTRFLFLSYKYWGVLLFCLVSAVILIPYLADIVKKHFGKVPTTFLNSGDYLKNVFLVNALIALAFFYFNTQMHERYIQPMILFMGTAVLLKPSKPLIAAYLLGSLAFILNMERVLQYFNLSDYHALYFSSRLIALMFLFTLILGLRELYYRRKLREDLNLLTNTVRKIFRSKPDDPEISKGESIPGY